MKLNENTKAELKKDFDFKTMIILFLEILMFSIVILSFIWVTQTDLL